MREYFPLLVVAAVVGLLSVIFIVAYATMKEKKEAVGFDRNMKDSELIRRLLSYAKPYTLHFVAVLLLILVAILYDIASPKLVGIIEKTVKDTFELPRLLALVAVYAGILVISLVAGYFQRVILQRVGQRIVSAIREDAFVHIEKLAQGQLSHIPVGKLVTRVTNDTGALSMLFTNILVNLIRNIFVILGVLGAMFATNVSLTLVVLALCPFLFLFTFIFRKFSRRAYRRVKDATTDINTFLSENLSGMKVTQIFNREEKKMAEFNGKNNLLGKSKQREILVFSVFRPLVYMLYVSSVMCLFFLGCKGYLDGADFLGQVITSDVIVTFYLYISKFFDPVQNLAEQFNWLQSAFASGEKIFSILDTVPEIRDAEDAIDLDTVRGDIEFSHVWFAYEGEEWVLRDVSFKVNAGETIAFVGATGSGKTTILSLLCRNYEPQKGEILVDGIPIRNIRVGSLRRHFGQMLQDVFLFSGTIRSNIVLREDKFTDDEVMEVCRYVNADSFINRLPGGLDEEVRERGNNFSAGQRQLISFARTILHKPEVMILDEATANIDTETEVLIRDSLEKIMNIGTMLMVAHRLSTVRHADRIYVISKGEIIESGSHDELIELRGKYYDLYTLQVHKQELEKQL